MKHSCLFHMDRSCSYPDLPKQSWYYVCSSLPSPGGFPLTCVPTSQVYHCIVFLAPCWYESSFFYQKCCLVIWFTEYPFPSLFKDLSLHHPFFYSDFRELHQLCNFLPSLLRNCLFPRYHFSVMISKEFSVSFHPQAFKISSPNNYTTETVCRDSPILDVDYFFVSRFGHSCSCSVR